MFKKIIIALCLIGFMGACETGYYDELCSMPAAAEKWKPTKNWHRTLLKKGMPVYQVEAIERGHYVFRWSELEYTKEDYIRDHGEPPPGLF